MNRVVLLDPYGTVEDVVAGLAGAPVEVEPATRIPNGSGVVALLLGPETPLTPEQVRDLPDLRIVAVTSTGYDHVPVEVVTERGAWVTAIGEYCTEEVADHAIAMILGLLRGVHALDRSVRAGRWDVMEVRPRRVAGTVLGLVGYGRIGRAVAARAGALGMRVLPYDRNRGDLEAVLGESDVVSPHLPLAPDTEGIFGTGAFAAMKPGSFFVNVARGGLVDHVALAGALHSGHLGGAALDVLPVEPPRPDDPLLDCPNLVLTPHAAWYSAEALTRPYRRAGRQVADVLAGRVPGGAVARPLLGAS